MMLNEVQRYLSQFVTLTLFVSAIGVLLATSESDIPSADSLSIEHSIAKEAQSVEFLVTFSKGPFEYDDFPLFLEINISHDELNEDFNFDGQSWTLVTSTGDGETPKRRVLFRRGTDGILHADRGKFTLQGTTSLYQCATGVTEQTEDTCIPCELDADQCSFVVELVREGAPYPAEVVQMKASQWLSNDTSPIQLELVAR